MTKNRSNYLGYWTLLVAISISAVAAYYSIVGLAVIFAAALIPVIIMGTVLEVAKITTAVWLHMNWSHAPFLLKAYLTSATVVLMFITSMGIYGFLSKAHIEQTAAGIESQALLERIDTDISSNEQALGRIQESLQQNSLRTQKEFNELQSQIDREQARIAQVVARFQPAIDEQQAIINREDLSRERSLVPVESEITRVENLIDQLKQEQIKITTLQNSSSDQDIRNELNSLEQSRAKFMNLLTSTDRSSILDLQRQLAVTADGRIGNETRSAAAAYQRSLDLRIEELKTRLQSENERQLEERQTRETRLLQISEQMQSATEELKQLKSRYENVFTVESDVTIKARQEISRIRESLNAEIDSGNQQIDNLRNRLANIDSSNIQEEEEKLLSEQKIIQSNLDSLYQEKFDIETSIRKLEAEIGPIKYIAELIYGTSADKAVLETAVRWVIILLVLVFDPLAIVLVIAGLHMLSLRDQPENHMSEYSSHLEVEKAFAESAGETVIETKPKTKRRYRKKETRVTEIDSKDTENTSSDTDEEAAVIAAEHSNKEDVELALSYNTALDTKTQPPKKITVAPAQPNRIIVRKTK